MLMARLVALIVALGFLSGVWGGPPFGLFDRSSSSASGTTDDCGQVNSQLTVKKANGRPYTAGVINACLCISQIPQFITENSVAASAVAVAGKSATIAALTDLIEGCSSHSQCRYPTHSSPSCKSSNPCYFSCTDGYTLSKSGTTCECKSPYKECNGKCGVYPSCNSRRASVDGLEGLLRREPGLLGAETKRDRGEIENGGGEEMRRRKARLGKSIAAKLGCQWGMEACGVFGGSRAAWECVDTANDLESCGGCTLPLTPLVTTPKLEDLLTFGTDCTAIPGVADVSCMNGSCAVSRCVRGWKVSSDASHCVKGKGNTS